MHFKLIGCHKRLKVLVMNKIKIVSKEEWEKARNQHLIKEKEFTKLRDQLSKERRELPWVKIEKDYIFYNAAGKIKFADLFENYNQLIIYHFMFGPESNNGCPICSFWADNFNGINIHLNQRNMNMIVVSRAPFEKLSAYQNKMGWNFKWYSSFGSDFNFDYQVSIIPEDENKTDQGEHRSCKDIKAFEIPGVSVFYKNDQNEIFHTYSTYGRGLDILNGAYNYMDLTPLGRDEKELPFSMAWVKRYNEYK